jgi:hypothetical protein
MKAIECIWTYHINAGARTFGCGRERAGLAVSADGTAPGASIFFGAGDAQRTVGMIAMRSQNVAFVQRDGQRSDVVIAIPDDRHLRFVFTDIGLVRILSKQRSKEMK